MELWIEIRRRVSSGELSKRKACAEYDIHWPGLFMRLGDVGSQVVSRDCSEWRLEDPLSPGGVRWLV